MKPERYRVTARLLLGYPAKGLGSPWERRLWPSADTPPPSATKPPKKPPERRPRPDIVHSSVYLPEAVYEALREAAFKERCKIHDLIMEGVGMALRKRGYPAIDH